MTTESEQAIAEHLRDIYLAFEKDGDSAIDRLADFYASDVVFRDPLQTIHGRSSFLAMNRRILKRASHLSFGVSAAVGARNSIFLAWTMHYAPKLGPALVFAGATHARLVDGLIAEQRDYWDLLSSLAQSIPFAGRIYTSLAPHLG